MVCDHVFEDNLRDGYLLSCFKGKLELQSPPTEVKYLDGTIGTCNAVITCGACPPSGAGINLLEFRYEKGKGFFA